jgi:hypothetical protein
MNGSDDQNRSGKPKLVRAAELIAASRSPRVRIRRSDDFVNARTSILFEDALKGATLGQPVVHFEIIGSDPSSRWDYYGGLFGWEFQTGDAVTEEVSQRGTYGYVDGDTEGINGGVGGGEGCEARVLFSV